MVDLDDRLRHDLARLRARAGPPVAAEERVLAALRATIGGGDPGSGGPSQGASLAEAGIDIGLQLLRRTRKPFRPDMHENGFSTQAEMRAA